MKELTILIDSGANDEFRDYLLSLNGIIDVDVNNTIGLSIYITYNDKLITAKIIKMEIELFLNLLKTPSIMGFDKHSNKNIATYIIFRKNICCEYCLKGTIDDLFEIQGIEKVGTNFCEDFDILSDIKINVCYDPDIISYEKMKQIDVGLNL